ncbi:prepilin-type N-terminal cleavage/methylation domain-containing protein [Photobacterium minamisatsumaniensis]|uniref:prepilin-type N-terminal cleavage/methylation domain-containing protein n=1 Tax=Photobacterium minamisatsumaniensis TaxID=2910233 RepID=UPI003D0B38F9
MKKQAGFSLVELVIVIIVVGLLAVAALPRFLNVTDEAKKAQIEGVAGGYATAVLSARAQWEADGRPQTSNEKHKVNYDGSDFMLTVATANNSVRDGYPIRYGDNNGATISNMTSGTCKELFEQLMQNPPQITDKAAEAKANGGNFQYFAKVSGNNNNAVCEYYQLASANTNNNDSNLSEESGHQFTYKPALGQVVVNLK